MVVKGKGRFPGRKPPKRPNKPSPTPLIGRIASLTRMPARDQALDLLHDLARMAAPIMSCFGFKVGVLCEMFPKNGQLLGLNVNSGSKICIRLRPPHNKNWFLPMNELVGTMLHELAHNQCGPHNDKFYEILDKLKNKYYEIQAKGSYQATGYLMENNRLGRASLLGSSSTVREARLKKLGKPKYVSKVTKLGTLRTTKNSSKPIRQLILEATERRVKDNKTCPSQMNQDDINQVVPRDEELNVVELDEEDDDEKKDGNPDLIIID
ncbi:hypothetical protein FOA43_000446 [Brettanomyces nanus]|uniref:WLM domain-containing protein n=1 Tax=Eeniella nana TaxID=13502 RepID=A0A875RN39_EENNA|nr:uncharacterized protein FOA43_000446 [Brettanomyces nanus]QPG73140.1 hypothetical protein FOA43_000446 [Brettanomyces nanus]